MKAYEISLFVVALAAATMLLVPTGIFNISQVSIQNLFNVAVIVNILVGGGITIMGFVFKLQAALIVFATLYGITVSTTSTLLFAFGVPNEINAVITSLLAFIGAWAAYQMAGGAMGAAE